jgi:hypothetical protein
MVGVRQGQRVRLTEGAANLARERREGTALGVKYLGARKLWGWVLFDGDERPQLYRLVHLEPVPEKVDAQAAAQFLRDAWGAR